MQAILQFKRGSCAYRRYTKTVKTFQCSLLPGRGPAASPPCLLRAAWHGRHSPPYTVGTPGGVWRGCRKNRRPKIIRRREYSPPSFSSFHVSFLNPPIHRLPSEKENFHVQSPPILPINGGRRKNRGHKKKWRLAEIIKPWEKETCRRAHQPAIRAGGPHPPCGKQCLAQAE